MAAKKYVNVEFLRHWNGPGNRIYNGPVQRTDGTYTDPDRGSFDEQTAHGVTAPRKDKDGKDVTIAKWRGYHVAGLDSEIVPGPRPEEK